MDWYLSLDEQRKILTKYVDRASGRPHDLLRVCLNAFPYPISQQKLMNALDIHNQKTFISLLRNANLVIEITRTISADGEYYYRLGGQNFKQSLISRWVGKKMSPE